VAASDELIQKHPVGEKFDDAKIADALDKVHDVAVAHETTLTSHTASVASLNTATAGLHLGAGHIYWGAGAPSNSNPVASPVAGDYFFRSDGAAAATSNIYLCTVGGATPTWVGLA